MSRSMDRFRIAHKQGLDEMSGDADTTRMATQGIAELLSKGGEIAAQQQAADAAKKKKTLIDQARAARQAAKVAAAEAKSEKDPNGPLHKKAKKLDEDASKAEAAAGLTGDDSDSTSSDLDGKGGGKKKHGAEEKGGMPWWGWVGIAVGTLGVGYVGWRLLHRGGAPQTTRSYMARGGVR